MIDPFVIYGERYSVNRNSLLVLHAEGTMTEEKPITSFKNLDV